MPESAPDGGVISIEEDDLVGADAVGDMGLYEVRYLLFLFRCCVSSVEGWSSRFISTKSPILISFASARNAIHVFDVY